MWQSTVPVAWWRCWIWHSALWFTLPCLALPCQKIVTHFPQPDRILIRNISSLVACSTLAHFDRPTASELGCAAHEANWVCLPQHSALYNVQLGAEADLACLNARELKCVFGFTCPLPTFSQHPYNQLSVFLILSSIPSTCQLTTTIWVLHFTSQYFPSTGSELTSQPRISSFDCNRKWSSWWPWNFQINSNKDFNTDVQFLVIPILMLKSAPGPLMTGTAGKLKSRQQLQVKFEQLQYLFGVACCLSFRISLCNDFSSNVFHFASPFESTNARIVKKKYWRKLTSGCSDYAGKLRSPHIYSLELIKVYLKSSEDLKALIINKDTTYGRLWKLTLNQKWK